VKRRLIPALGAEGAAALHKRMTAAAIETALTAGIGPVQIWCTPSPEHAYFRFLRQKYGVTLCCQTGSDLGARMHHAFSSVLREHGCAILTGSDCPFLMAEDLAAAAQWLRAGSDAVIAPAADGGYVLIALTRPEPYLFLDVPWGTDSVLNITRQRLRRLGWHWSELPVYSDVDRPVDLALLAEEWLQALR
jgi:rSAM/selenodomain-associated transferase 1